MKFKRTRTGQYISADGRFIIEKTYDNKWSIYEDVGRTDNKLEYVITYTYLRDAKDYVCGNTYEETKKSVASIMNHYDNTCEKWKIALAKKNQRTWICYYIDKQGYEKQKVFFDMEDGLAFTRLLDKRIDKGTCGGYSFMEM